METVKTIIENTKESVLSAVGMNQPTTDEANQQHHSTTQPKTVTDEEDLKNSPTTMETVKEVVQSALDKARELSGIGADKASDLKEAIQNLKETTTQKISDATNYGSRETNNEEDQKINNWNKSISKIEESHKVPLHPTHGSENPEPVTNESDEGFQQKLIQLKDSAVENLGQAKEVVTQKFSELQTAVVSQFPSTDSVGSNPFQSTVDSAKDLIEIGKEKISNLTTGTFTAKHEQDEQKKHVEPIDSNLTTESKKEESGKNLENMKNNVSETLTSVKDKATEKIEKLTEGGIRDIGVIDAPGAKTDEKKMNSISKEVTSSQLNQEETTNLSA